MTEKRFNKRLKMRKSVGLCSLLTYLSLHAVLGDNFKQIKKYIERYGEIMFYGGLSLSFLAFLDWELAWLYFESWYLF